MKNKIYSVAVLIGFLMASNVFAALSASVSGSPSTVRINQPVAVSVSISNTGSALSLQSLNITANYNGVSGGKVPAAFSVLNLGANSPSIALAANATTVIPMTAVFFSPSTGVTGSGSGQFYVGANFQTSDGSVTSAGTAARITVNSPSNLIGL